MRKIININKCWKFKKDFLNNTETESQLVNIPHNWNSIDGQDGKNDYFRGACEYTNELNIPTLETNERLFVEFQGVNSSCSVYFNDVKLGEHDGGYSTFRFEINKELIKDKNIIKVDVDNSANEKVYPQRADFTFYGGIYRDVNLIIVNENHFDLIKYGALGCDINVYMNDDDGVIEVTPYIVGVGDIKLTLLDKNQKIILQDISLKVIVSLPHLWNGIKDPYLYTLKIDLINNGEIVDEISKKIGFRSYDVDSKKGFYLNKKLYLLRGVSRHQDRKNIGNSINKIQQDEDMKCIQEMGANTIRLAHYQHNDYFLDLCDEVGMIVWAEIPYISKHMDKGNDNTISQMKELIAQQKHHPSICFWGTSNEITMFKGHQKQLVAQNKVLNKLCHEFDPHRLTTLACFAMCGPFNKVTNITDVVSWNFYFGWYTPFLFLNNLWFDFYHLFNSKRAVGLSEYGAEGMTNLHSNHPHRGDSSEEYQLIYHEYLLRFISKRPWLWATHVWNMFDFGSDGRNQGGDPGVNHKGLMTFDHKTKKDSYYIYQAYWTDKPMTYIAGKRFINRNGRKTLIRIITNEEEVKLTINDKEIKTLKGRKYYKVRIPLKGNIKVCALGKSSKDEFTFNKVAKFDENYKLHTVSNNYSWEK